MNITGPVENINFQNSNTYSVGLSYYGHPDLAEVKTTVQNKTLNIDSTQFNWHRNCQVICIPDTYNLSITVYAPDAYQLANQLGSAPIMPPVAYSPPPKYMSRP